jgi:hypothetical protein
MPINNGERNYFHVKIVNGDTRAGSWNCRANYHRALVDKAMDALFVGDGKDRFTRDTRCMLGGWYSC